MSEHLKPHLKTALQALTSSLDASMQSAGQQFDGPLTLSVSLVSSTGTPIMEDMYYCYGDDGKLDWRRRNECRPRPGGI